MTTSPYNQGFAERFNLVLDQHGLPPRNQGRIQVIADMFLLSHAGAGKWVNGLSVPTRKRLKEVAQRLGVSYDWLAFGKGEMQSTPKALTGTHYKLPVLSFSEAPHYDKLLTNFSGQYIELDLQGVSPLAFAVYCIGSAMSIRFPEGTLLVVDPKPEINDGDYVLATIAKLPEAIFRQIIFGETGKFLYAHDPRYQSHKLSDGDTIIGKVVEARMKL